MLRTCQNRSLAGDFWVGCPRSWWCLAAVLAMELAKHKERSKTEMSIVTSPEESVGAGTSGDFPHWQAAMKRAIRNLGDLRCTLGLPQDRSGEALAAESQFPVFVPLEYLAKIKRADPQDPLLRQVLPQTEEMALVGQFTADPVDDRAARLEPGLLQKYQGRVLMITTGACAVHCRYCFRRHYPYASEPNLTESWQRAIERIASDTSIDEVILSGGDPLTVADSRLAELAGQIAAIKHVSRLRIHTRLPVMIPQRVNDELLSWLAEIDLQKIVVVHVNHPQEIDQAVGQSFERLCDAGITVLNQSVLLRGINDNAETLAELSRRLLRHRVLPYYLHQLDQVAGAAHFKVSIDEGRQIMRQLRTQLPGYGVPRYVQEIVGEPNKVVLE